MDSVNMMDRTVCLQFRLGQPGNSAKVDAGDFAEDNRAEESSVTISKRLLKSKEYTEISALSGEIRGWLRRVSLPSMLRSGLYLIPLDLVQMVDDKLAYFSGERDKLVDAFMAAYPTQVEQAREHLGDLWNEADYPRAARVRQAFTWDARWLTFSTPNTLKSISRSLFERERQKAEAAWSSFAEDAKYLLLDELQGFIDHALEKLTPDDDGKAKRFKPTSAFKNIAEFLETFDARNITGWEDLTRVAQRAREVIEGVDPQSLRMKAENFEQRRADVARGFSEIKRTLDTLVEQRPKRRINLDEEV